MTWAFGLPLEPRAKLALLAIADNARDDGIAWPSRDMIAEKSSQSRATINRRLRILSDLGVLGIFERYREDGSQTTDEIRLDLSLLPDEVMRRMQGLSVDDRGESADESGSVDADTSERNEGEGGCQADTPPVHSGHPPHAVGTRGGLHSGHPLNEPSLEPSKTPPNPPPGGPLSKSDKEAIERREALWQRFLAGYPGIGAMDQRAASDEFDPLSLSDAEWAVSVLPQLKEELRKANSRAPKNAHIWLRKRMFTNFPKAKIEAPPPDEVWIVEGSDEDRVLRFLRSLVRSPARFVRSRPDGSRGYPHKTQVGADLLAMLAFIEDVPLRWASYPRGSPEFAAWQARFTSWLGQGLPIEPGSDGIRAPCRWPPKKDGTIYSDHDGNEGETAA